MNSSPYRENSKMACGCPGEDPRSNCESCERLRREKLAATMAALMERVWRMRPLQW